MFWDFILALNLYLSKYKKDKGWLATFSHNSSYILDYTLKRIKISYLMTKMIFRLSMLIL